MNGREDGGHDELGVPTHGRRGAWLGWYEDGQKAYEYRLSEDGRHVGLSQRWYSNGQLASEGTPPDRFGRCTVIQWRTNGTKWIESMQNEDGELDGNWVEWDGDGKLLKQETYERGRRICQGRACP